MKPWNIISSSNGTNRRHFCIMGQIALSTTTGGEWAIKNTLRSCLIFYDILSLCPLMFEIHLLLIHNCTNRNDIRMLCLVSLPALAWYVFCFIIDGLWWKRFLQFHSEMSFFIKVNFSFRTPTQINMKHETIVKPGRVLTLFATNEEMECNDSFSFS